ncbi:phosphatidylglycerophosphate synthase [Neorhizobium galegae]|uniref:CDP-alcohol phosphatidyltransferase family protein n=1 Tax=Neorhizobium galegae TaxID=399 RepID=UPI001AE3A9DA|nr:CDP-alcohol phosphatidyltransferase family protein [Neorhizobium galegae]MBP2550633.1 phosphatidylglycerophosphate synthase [Neorhizobium galegae]
MSIHDERHGAGFASRLRPAFFSHDPLLLNTLKVLCVVYLASIASWAMAASHLPLEIHVPIIAGILLAGIFAAVVHGLPFHRHLRFGYANLVTALRAGIVSFVAATVLFSQSFGGPHLDAMIWWMVAAVLSALALDGVDGYLARRFRQQSALGARFDMEVDAALILILSVAALVLGKAGAWVVLIGLMRYLFVLAQWFLPALRAELSPSLRRKTVCVVQGAALCLVLVPQVTAPLSAWICGGALAALTYSFGVDVLALMRRKVDAT